MKQKHTQTADAQAIKCAAVPLQAAELSLLIVHYSNNVAVGLRPTLYSLAVVQTLMK